MKGNKMIVEIGKEYRDIILVVNVMKIVKYLWLVKLANCLVFIVDEMQTINKMCIVK